MKAFLKKYFEAVIYVLQLPYNKKRISGIQYKNTLLRQNQVSDIGRWQAKKELNHNWNERTAILGGFVRPGAAIIEFGAGAMFLKNHIKNYKSYTPSDIVKRSEEIIVCDLNQPIAIDLSGYDTAIFSGVLEYVFDIDKIFSQFRSQEQLDHVILSYCCSDLVKASREKNGWLSDYTKAQMEAVFRKYGYMIKDYREWNDQSIFNLARRP